MLEKAIAEPVRPKAQEPVVEKPPVIPVIPVQPQIRTFSEGQRHALMGALTAVKKWKPGMNPTTKIPSNQTSQEVTR